MPKSLWGRLFGSYLVVVLLTLSVSSVLITYLVERVVIEERLRDLTRRATRLAQGFSQDGLGQNMRNRPLWMLRETLADEFWIVNGEGVIVASSAPMERLVGRSLPRDEWEMLHQGQVVALRRTHSLLQQPYLLVGIPVRRRGATVGAIYIHTPLSGIRSAMAEVRNVIALSGIAGVMGALGLSFWFSKGMIAPLEELLTATRRFAKAEYNTSIQPTGIAELDSLGTGFNALGRDLAQTVAQLEQEREQAQGILQNMSEGVALYSADGVLLHLNRAASEFLPSEAFQAELSRLVAKCWSKEHPLQVEEQVTVGERTLLVRADTLYAKNEVRGAVAVLIDISSRRQLEEARSGFVAIVSHELRTPLAHIQGYIEAIMDGIANDESTKSEYLRIALNETLRLRRLSQDLLTLAETDAGTLRLKKIELPVAAFLEEVVHPWRLLAEKRGLRLREEVQVASPLMVDPDRLKQVLDNLLENAFAHTAANQDIVISAKEYERSMVFTVADSGCGIPEEALRHIWERFYRIDSARTRHLGGSGLGLAIVKELVELHGGRVAVTSKHEQGTSFEITMPK